MSFKFKIWDQGHDGQTSAIRVQNVTELAIFARACTGPDRRGRWPTLLDYLAALDVASSPPEPFERTVELVWLSRLGYTTVRRFPAVRLVVTYSGRVRQSGGFAAQAYCVFDPHGFPALGLECKRSISVDYFPRIRSDLLIVRP